MSFTEVFTTLAQSIPHPLVVFLMGMLPITELQGAIIFAITVLHMNPWLAFFAGTAGCISMSIFLIFFLEHITLFLRKHFKFFDRFFSKLFEKTQAKYSEGIRDLGYFALFTYIVIPTPGSGAWTGALIAYVFGLSRKKAALILGPGLILTGIIVLSGTEGVLYLWNN